MAGAALLIAYFGVGFLQRRSCFSDKHLYSTVYPCGRGINASSPVLLSGVGVGYVRSVEVLPKQDYSVLVTFDVRKDITLTQSSKARLVDLSPLFDTKGIELVLDATGEPLEHGGRVPGEAIRSLQETFSSEATPIVQNAHEISEHVRRLTATLSESRVCIQNTLENMRACTAQLHQMLSENRAGIAVIHQNLVETSAALADKKQGVGVVLAKLNQIASAIDLQDIAHLQASVQTLHTLLAQLESGQGTLGHLMQDDTLHKHLCNTVAGVGHLLNDVRIHPWRYVHFSVFGTRHRPPKSVSTE